MKKIFAGVVSVFFLFFFVSVPAFAWEWPWGKEDPITSLRKSGVDVNSGRISTSLKVTEIQKGNASSPNEDSIGTKLIGKGQSLETLVMKYKGESLILVHLCIGSEVFYECPDRTTYLSSSINKKWRKTERGKSLRDTLTKEERGFF